MNPTTAGVNVQQRELVRKQGMQGHRTRKYPKVRGGVCEFCGILDANVDSQDQYKLCPHFRGLGEMRCSYCDEARNPVDVVSHAVLNVAEHPDDSNKLVVWCNSYTCSGKHIARFRVNR